MKRPLIASIIGFISASTISIVSNAMVSRICFSIFLSSFILIAILRSVLKKHSLTFVALLLAFITCGFALCTFIHIPHMKKVRSFNGYSGDITAEITRLEKFEYFSRYTVKTLTIGSHHISTNISFSSNISDDSLKEGDIVRIGGRIHTEFNNTLTYNAERSSASDGVFVLLDEDYIFKEESSPNLFRRAIFNIRENCLSKIRQLDNSGLISALTLGDKSTLDAETNTTFKKLGLSHALAVSGMHLSILIMSLYIFLKKRSVGKYLSSTVCSVLVVVYMILTGLSFSVMRAGVMMIIYFVSLLVRRQNDSVTTLFSSALLITAQNPWSVFDVGFQLSFFATLGILTFCPKIMERISSLKIFVKKAQDARVLSFIKKYLRKILLSASLIFVTSLSATVSTLPLTLLHFNSFNIFSIFANICVLSLINLLLIVSTIHLLVTSFYLIPISFVTESVCNFLSNAVESLTRFMADIFPAPLTFSPELSSAIAYTCSVIILFFFIFFKKRRVLFILTLILCIVSTSVYYSYNALTKDNIQVMFSTAKSCRDIIIEENGFTTLISFPAKNPSFYHLSQMLSYRNVVKIDKAIFVVDNTVPYDKIESLFRYCKVKEIALTSSDGIIYNNDKKKLGDISPKGCRLTEINIGKEQISDCVSFEFYPESYAQATIDKKEKSILISHSIENNAFAPINTYFDRNGIVIFGENEYYPQISPSAFYLCDIQDGSYIKDPITNLNQFDYYSIKITPDNIEHSSYK